MVQHILCRLLVNNNNKLQPGKLWSCAHDWLRHPTTDWPDATTTQRFSIGLLPSLFWKKAFIFPGSRPHVRANAASFQTGSSGLVKLVCLVVATRERVQMKSRLCTVQTLACGISLLKLKQTTKQTGNMWKSQNNSHRLLKNKNNPRFWVVTPVHKTDLRLWSPPAWACCVHRRLWWCTQPPWWSKWCLAWVLQWPFPKGGEEGGKQERRMKRFKSTFNFWWSNPHFMQDIHP